VGNGLSIEQEHSHFALWAMMKGPLLMGTDLTNLTQEQIDILQNKYLLAFNQDPIVGKPARPYKWGINPDYTFNSTYPAMYWSGTSSNGTMVALFNPTIEEMTMSAEFGEIPQLCGVGSAWVAWRATLRSMLLGTILLSSCLVMNAARSRQTRPDR
jgi:alpha-galactosidase